MTPDEGWSWDLIPNIVAGCAVILLGTAGATAAWLSAGSTTTSSGSLGRERRSSSDAERARVFVGEEWLLRLDSNQQPSG